MFTACQSQGGDALQTSEPTLTNAGALAVVPRPPILGITDGAATGQVVIQYGEGITPDTALATGRTYGLSLTGGPLMTGPMRAGRYTYEFPQASIDAISPTNAILYLPGVTTAAERRQFLTDNHLGFLRRLRPDDGFIVATVKLPPADLHPRLLDPVLGKFQIALPTGLSMQSVLEWAKQGNLRLISYTPETGATLVHPNSWQPPVVRPTRLYPRSAAPAIQSPLAGLSLLYVQFTSNVTSSSITAIAQGLGLGVVSVTAGGLATLSLQRSRTKAEIQLLSDIASVQCVSTSQNACAVTGGAAAAASQAPMVQPLGQPTELTAAVRDGVLELSWNPASGATAYAIFQAQAAGGPFELVAMVAGQQHTQLPVMDVLPAGTPSFFEVLALRPCAQPGDSAACDSVSPALSGTGAPSVSWTNPAPVAAPATASPDPSASPALAAPPPAQTVGGPGPLPAPAALVASADDGHVALTWAAVAGASMYRVYRSASGGPFLYVAQTSGLTFTDVGGAVGKSYA
ncbi:MAG: hypothetical protein E6I72_09465, partial [Chloroflexi bacterium]